MSQIEKFEFLSIIVELRTIKHHEKFQRVEVLNGSSFTVLLGGSCYFAFYIIKNFLL